MLSHSFNPTFSVQTSPSTAAATSRPPGAPLQPHPPPISGSSTTVAATGFLHPPPPPPLVGSGAAGAGMGPASAAAAAAAAVGQPPFLANPMVSEDTWTFTRRLRNPTHLHKERERCLPIIEIIS